MEADGTELALSASEVLATVDRVTEAHVLEGKDVIDDPEVCRSGVSCSRCVRDGMRLRQDDLFHGDTS